MHLYVQLLRGVITTDGLHFMSSSSSLSVPGLPPTELVTGPRAARSSETIANSSIATSDLVEAVRCKAGTRQDERYENRPLRSRALCAPHRRSTRVC